MGGPNVNWSMLPVIAEDISINYARGGSGEPIIFLHGWPEFNRTWMHNLPVLARQYDVIAPDLRGFGKTVSITEDMAPGRRGGTPPQLLARDLKNFADALELERFAIVSHDVGSAVAQTFTQAHPERVSTLFFFNCVYPGIGKRWGDPEHAGETWYQQFHQKPFAADLIGSSREATRIYLSSMLAHWSCDRGVFDSVLPEWVDNFCRPGNLQGGFDWYIGVNKYRTRLISEGPPDIPKITQKTFVLWGEDDPILKIEWADRLDDYFESLEFENAPDTGHFVHFEQPELANRRMLHFFDAALE